MAGRKWKKAYGAAGAAGKILKHPFGQIATGDLCCCGVICCDCAALLALASDETKCLQVVFTGGITTTIVLRHRFPEPFHCEIWTDDGPVTIYDDGAGQPDHSCLVPPGETAIIEFVELRCPDDLTEPFLLVYFQPQILCTVGYLNGVDRWPAYSLTCTEPFSGIWKTVVYDDLGQPCNCANGTEITLTITVIDCPP